MNDAVLFHLKVLYVEDDDETREELGYYLKKRVGKVFLARNGEEGLLQYERNKPDIVITDSRMPVMNGIDMSAKIREQDNDVSIIVTTAFSDVDAVIKAIDMGVNKYILKPVVATELLDTLRDCAYKSMGESQGLVVDNHLVYDLEQKKAYEKEIQIQFAAFLKDRTGKGPKMVKAFLNRDLLEIRAIEPMTKYEMSLLERGKNERIVRFVRESFYNSYRQEIQTLVGDILSISAKLESVESDSYHKTDKLTVRIITKNQ